MNRTRSLTQQSMAKSPSLELDFFGMEKRSTAPVFQRRRSFRDIQGVISKMNPEVVKSVIGNGGLGSKKSTSSASVAPPQSPISDPKLRAPMTIFYNGVVSVFDVSPRKAQNILKAADESLPPKSAENLESNTKTERNLLESLNGDLPISRKNSLQRFLEKRKERLVVVSPYLIPLCRDVNRASPPGFGPTLFGLRVNRVRANRVVIFSGYKSSALTLKARVSGYPIGLIGLLPIKLTCNQSNK